MLFILFTLFLLSVCGVLYVPLWIWVTLFVLYLVTYPA